MYTSATTGEALKQAVWCIQQIKQSTILIWPRSGWICFLDKQSVHLIRREIEFPHIKKKKTTERVTGCFLRRLYLHCVEERGGDLLLHLKCAPERSLPCVLPCLISLCAEQHHAPLAPLSQSDTWSSWWERVCAWGLLVWCQKCSAGLQVWCKQESSHLFAERRWIASVELICCLSLQRQS